jgi:Cft2 family RNA processing exonuclease
MTSEQRLQIHNYYKELVSNDIIKTPNEAKIFKLSYEKAFSLTDVVKSFKDRKELTFEDWIIIRGYTKSGTYYFRNNKRISQKEVIRRYEFGLQNL